MIAWLDVLKSRGSRSSCLPFNLLIFLNFELLYSHRLVQLKYYLGTLTAGTLIENQSSSADPLWERCSTSFTLCLLAQCVGWVLAPPSTRGAKNSGAFPLWCNPQTGCARQSRPFLYVTVFGISTFSLVPEVLGCDFPSKTPIRATKCWQAQVILVVI